MKNKSPFLEAFDKQDQESSDLFWLIVGSLCGCALIAVLCLMYAR